MASPFSSSAWKYMPTPVGTRNDALPDLKGLPVHLQQRHTLREPLIALLALPPQQHAAQAHQPEAVVATGVNGSGNQVSHLCRTHRLSFPVVEFMEKGSKVMGGHLSPGWL
jgi:hypothetical protein